MDSCNESDISSLSLSSLMLEWDDLLDGHLVAGDGVGGGGHHAVRALTEELQVVVSRPDLREDLIKDTEVQ